MTLQVSHPALLDCDVVVGERTVHFDAAGVSPALTGAEHVRLLGIPGYADATERPPVPRRNGEELLAAYQAAEPEIREWWYNGLPLVERLDLAMNPELDGETAGRFFDLESKHRKSKQVLTRLDQTLTKLRASKDARQVTQSMLTANFPTNQES